MAASTAPDAKKISGFEYTLTAFFTTGRIPPCRIVFRDRKNRNIESRPDQSLTPIAIMPSIFPRLPKRIWWIALVFIGVTGIALYFLLQLAGVPPRSLGPYIERRTSGHNPLIVHTGLWTARALKFLDRGEPNFHIPPSLRPGAYAGLPAGSSPVPATFLPTSRPEASTLLVASADEAARAIAGARPGDVITLLPGVYKFNGSSIAVSRAGTATRRITVRADRPGTVFLEFALLEGFVVSAPYWTFENLNIRGVCSVHAYCEHAFHVVGKGAHFTARNNRITDFNAHFKINGENENMPDHGTIEGNTLSNGSARQTHFPVTLIDIVAASGWVIRGNLIRDFVKAEGDRISYGAFAKGAGKNNRFDQNIVLCESLLAGAPGQRVGLSLGGGGTGPEFCRDKRCITEQDDSIIQSNLIASCSDDGIYINRSAASKILHNTLIDTGGIVVRFAESSADVQGNLVDGSIRSRNNGVIRASDNVETSMMNLYLGIHPVRNLFKDLGVLDLTWNHQPPRRANAEQLPPDLCGASRPANPAYGAFEGFSKCFR
jgi:parallel beta-helix repeat protein